MVLGGEVDIVLIGTRVDASLEIDTLQIPVVPPVPGYFSRFDPVCAAYLIGCGEGINEIVHWHFGILFRDGHHAPRIGSWAFGFGDIVLGFGYVAHASPFVVIHLFWIFCEGGSQM